MRGFFLILLFAFCPVRRLKRHEKASCHFSHLLKSLRKSVMDEDFISLVRYIKKTCDPSFTDLN